MPNAHMRAASEYLNAVMDSDDDAQRAIVERLSVGYIRRGMRQWALASERAAEATTGDESAEWSAVAVEFWSQREELDAWTHNGLDEPTVEFTPDNAFSIATGSNA